VIERQTKVGDSVSIRIATEIVGGHINPAYRLTRPELKAGDVLVVAFGFRTLADHQFNPGDRIELVERVNQKPYGFICTLGNWRVRTPYQEAEGTQSIWSGIDRMYEEGLLRLEAKT
jgi:hypothetical protein